MSQKSLLCDLAAPRVPVYASVQIGDRSSSFWVVLASECLVCCRLCENYACSTVVYGLRFFHVLCCWLALLACRCSNLEVINWTSSPASMPALSECASGEGGCKRATGAGAGRLSNMINM